MKRRAVRTRAKAVSARRPARKAAASEPVTAPLLWTFTPKSSSAIGLHVDQNLCWYGNEAGQVFAISHDRKVQASYQLPNQVWCIVADDVWRYAGCNDGHVYDLSGRTPRIAYTVGRDVEVCWLTILRGRLAVGDKKGVVTVFDHEGELLWKKKGAGREAWLLRCDGMRLYHGHTHGVSAYDWNGKTLWTCKTPGEVQTGWLEGGSIYAPLETLSRNAVTCEISTDGKRGVDFECDSTFLPACAASPGGERVYVADRFDTICCFDSRGKRLWKADTGCGSGGTLQYFDGKLYIGSWSGTLACMDVSDEAIAAARLGRRPRTHVISAKGRRATVADEAVASRVATTGAAGKGVVVQCVKEGAKLRIRVVGDGFNPSWNCQFPRALRVEGARYVVDEIREAQGGGFYRAFGDIKRLEP